MTREDRLLNHYYRKGSGGFTEIAVGAYRRGNVLLFATGRPLRGFPSLPEGAGGTGWQDWRERHTRLATGSNTRNFRIS